jgi:hypothetical protein
MLNLAFIFDDAIHALTRYAKGLAVVPLPAAVYMMQVDVINHYHYALEHYLTVALDEPFLQNSSRGTPYQKWALVTNEDFETLSFAIHNLLRYTSRLIHETECLVPEGDRFSEEQRNAFAERLLQSGKKYWEERSIKSNSYTSPISEIRYWNKSIGVMIHDGHRLSIVAVRTEPSPEGWKVQSAAGEPTLYFRVTIVDGIEHEQPIEKDEYERLLRLTGTIQAKEIDIRDRSRLVTLQERGRVEVAELRSRNRAFAEVCNAFYQSRRVAQPFDNLNASYWI